MSAPSAWQIEHAVAAWQATRARILAEDETLEGDEAALTALLGEEAGDIDDILARVLRSAIHASDMAKAANARAEATAARASRYSARSDTLKGAAFALMECLGRKKAEYADVSATIGKPRASVAITDETALPEEYWRITRTPNKAAIRDDLKAGVVIEGAILEDGLPSFTIKGN